MAPSGRLLLSDQLHALVQWLEATDVERPELFGSRDEYEWLLRLAAVVLALLDRHRVDGQGRCRQCGLSRDGWRRLMPLWGQRSPCRVRRAAVFFMRAELAVVWWQVFALRGDRLDLDDVRAWLAIQQIAASDVEPSLAQEWPDEDESDVGRHALLTDARVRLREETRPTAAEADRVSARPHVQPEFSAAHLPGASAGPAEAPTDVLPKITEH